VTEPRRTYAANGMTATFTRVKQFNHSEYNESDDRHVDLAFEFNGKTKNP